LDNPSAKPTSFFPGFWFIIQEMERKLTKIYCDGGARGNPGPAASGFVVEKEGKVIFKGSEFLGEATNNVAEYQAVIIALNWLIKNSEKVSEEILFVLDSELVVKQLKGIFKVKNENLRNLFFTVKELESKINLRISYASVPREKNKLADFLVNKMLDNVL
jgi:ribonuclease HI